MFTKRNLPPPSLSLVTHPESDPEYMHFQPQMADGSIRRAADVTPFDATARGFSPVNAWWLADAALLSYWDAGVATTRFREQAGLESEFVTSGGTQSYVAWNDKAVIVSFRPWWPPFWCSRWSRSACSSPVRAGAAAPRWRHRTSSAWRRRTPSRPPLRRSSSSTWSASMATM